MTVSPVLDAAGGGVRRRRCRLSAGRPPRNKGPPSCRPADRGGDRRGDARDRRDGHGYRLRALIVVLWRGGLRIQEALALGERDLDPRRGSVLVRNGKGGRRREIGMDAWGWEQLGPGSDARRRAPVGPLFCVIDGPTRGRPWSSANGASSSAGSPPKRASAPSAAPAAPRPRRRARREGVPLNVIQRQLGHANLGTTAIYLQGIDTERSSPRPRPARADDVRHAPASSSEQPETASAAAAPLLRLLARDRRPLMVVRSSHRLGPRLASRPDLVQGDRPPRLSGDDRIRTTASVGRALAQTLACSQWRQRGAGPCVDEAASSGRATSGLDSRGGGSPPRRSHPPGGVDGGAFAGDRSRARPAA